MKELSIGAVIYNKSIKKYLILQYGAGHWDFVKGKREKGESDLETVRREAEEETGLIDLEFLDGYKEKITYKFKSNNEVINKEVIFYFALSKEKEIKLSYEHTDFVWLSIEKAALKVTHKNAKQLLEKANTFLEENRGRKKQKGLFHF